MTSKLKIKIGVVEFEYEGDAQFNQESIKDLFSHMESLVSGANKLASSSAGAAASHGEKQGGSAAAGMHINSIAAKLNADKGPELSIAAAYYLRGQGKVVASKAELLEAMREAVTYFKKNMVGNHGKNLGRLVSNGRLLQNGADAYSLSADELKSLGTKLA